MQARVAWVDTDAGGRIHYTAAFRWAEAAETGLFRSLGLLEDFAAFPRRAVEAEYLRVLRFGDEVLLTIRVESVGRTSVRLVWEGLHRGELAVRGALTTVHVDSEGRPEPIDDRTRALLTG